VNLVAAKSADGKRLVVKLVNPAETAAEMRMDIVGGFQPKTAKMHLIAPDDLTARNSLQNPGAVHAVEREITPEENGIRVRLPRWSVAVIDITR